MTYQVTITNQANRVSRFKDFATFQKAYQYYLEQCEDKGCDNMEQPVDQKTEMNLDAGGRGYDYRITLEIIEEK